jgi:hypothetical protein
MQFPAKNQRKFNPGFWIGFSMLAWGGNTLVLCPAGGQSANLAQKRNGK